MPISAEKLLESLNNPYFPALKKHSITTDRLAKQLDEELVALEPKFLKLKKSEFDPVKFNAAKIPKGLTIVFETAAEILLRVDLPLISIRQAARMDAQRIMGLYPKEPIEIHTDKPILIMTKAEAPPEKGKEKGNGSGSKT